MDCHVRQNLLVAFVAAALEHADAVNALTDLAGLGSNESVNAKRQTEQTSAKFQAARLALQTHQAEHQCREENPAQ